MSRKLPIFYSALLLTGVNLLLRLVSTSFQVFLSGRIGAEGIGLLQLVLSVGGLSMTAGMAGIRTATMYLTAEELGKNRPENTGSILKACFLYSISCSCAVGCILYFAAPVIAQQWIGDICTLGAVRLVAFFLPIVCLSGSMTGYFTAANRIGTLAIVEIGEQLCYMAVTMTALIFWAHGDPGKACRAVVLGSGVSAGFTLFCLLILRSSAKHKEKHKIPVASRLLHTAVPLALADDLKAGISTTENLMVPKRLSLYPGEAAPLAAFGTVCGMVFPVLMFPAAILFALAELLIPELARCNAAGSKTRIQYLAHRSLRIALLYGCLCGAVLFLLSKELCLWLYDSSDAGRYLMYYALLAPMLYCDAITDAMTKGLGQQQTAVRYNILTAALDVLFLFLLLPKYGMHGYFISFLITHLLNFLLSLRLLIRTSGITIPFYIPALTLAAAIGAAWGAGLVHIPFWRVFCFFALFSSLLVLFRVISKEDLTWISGLIRKK